MAEEPHNGQPERFRNEQVERQLREQWISIHVREHDREKEAVAAALVAQKAAIEAALVASDRAVAKAEIAAEKRFDNVNEFRETLADQQRMLMPRNEAELQFSSFATQLKELQIRAEKIESASVGKHDATTLYMSVGFFVLSLLGLVISLIINFR